jgi:hypothetical protein
MGVVYEGFDPVIGRRVAIKTMLTEGLTSDEFGEYRARFQREAQAAGVLSHPNIVSIFDYGEDSGILYLVMEYLEGISLEKLIKGHNILPIETIIPMYVQVCSALEHAHQHGIVHRDIKPANIMIVGSGLAKVTDFGIAKIESMGMTQTGQVLGTPHYMSPEQVKGRQIDGRSDIFSLGVILYNLVTGEMPFAGQNITTVIYKIINKDPIPPRELDASIHPGLSFVICKALAKSPDERYQTCRELADDLKNFQYLGRQAAAPATVPPLQGTDLERAAGLPVESLIPPVAPAEAAGIAAQSLSPGRVPVAVTAPAPTYQKPRALTMGWILTTLFGLTVLGLFGVAGYLYFHQGKTRVANLAVGELYVESNIPGARISVDGQSEPNWVAPYTIPGLSPGSHQIVVSKEGYDSYQQAVTIEGGRTNSVTASLLAQVGQPLINPPAEQAVAGKGKPSTKESGTSPASLLRSASGGGLGTSRPSSPSGGGPGATPAPAASGGGSGATPAPTASGGGPSTIPAPTASGGGPGATPAPATSGGGPGATPAPATSGGGPGTTPEMGQLVVTANVAGAKFSVDGRSEPDWVTPYASTIKRPPGNHQVVISKEGYVEYEQFVTLEGGKTTTVNAQLSVASGEVVVITKPPGLEVLIDGKLIGLSPVRLTVVVGNHKYTVRRPGSEPYEGTVKVDNGTLMTVRVEMGG